MTPGPETLIPAAVIAIPALLALAYGRGGGRTARLHRRNRRKAGKAIRRLNRGDMTPAQKMGYLRRIDPFVFEELTLTALGMNGYRPRRNRRYTGDGGTDGSVRRHGRTYLVQCKRYTGYINPSDVEEFATLCEIRGKRGLFVHTGKTGRKSRDLARESRVRVISGDSLLAMIGDK